jgi:hypothetical protein
VPSERFGGLKIDHEFVFGRLKNWQIGWLRAFEDLPDVPAWATSNTSCVIAD